MRRKAPIQIKSGKWYAAGHGPPLREECCDCGLVHDVEYRFELRSGTLKVWVRWIVNDKETRQARRTPQQFVRAGRRPNGRIHNLGLKLWMKVLF